MTDRVQDDDSLIPPGGDPSGIIRDPIIVVHRSDGESIRFVLMLNEIDKNLDDPRTVGILLSDLLDHVATLYHKASGRDPRDVRSAIFKVMRDEDRFKEKDPTRGNPKGATVWPRKQ